MLTILSKNCCDPSSLQSSVDAINQTEAVETRYAAAAGEREACLCSPVSFNKKLLEVIPSNVIERDYGCGDPTCWVKSGDKVLDLGSGSGKNAFICAQLIGASGEVIGIDRNQKMLTLARNAAPKVAKKLGFSNVSFYEGEIEFIDKIEINNSRVISNSMIDIVLSNCVLNLVNPSNRNTLLENIRKVLKPSGRVAISDIVSNHSVPLSLQKDPELWSGCISGAWQEDKFLEDFRALGFQDVCFADRSNTPWKIVDGIEFRAVTLIGHL